MKSYLVGTLVAAGVLLLLLGLRSTPQEVTDSPECGFTSDFYNFLDNNGYWTYNFNRSQLPCGAYGGKSSSSQTLTRAPVIFIHDNQDVGYGRGPMDGYLSWQTGFRYIARTLIDSGYTSAELYTTTWGDAGATSPNSTYHSKDTLIKLRKFIEAVLSYTGTRQVNIIAHGMGVTLARKVIKGGTGQDHIAGYYDLGNSIKQFVRLFVGIAGYNLGLPFCTPGPIVALCSNKDGFFPGTVLGTGLSQYLSDLNTRGGAEADTVWSVWSTDDQKIGPGSLIFNKVTCRINGQTNEIKKTTSDWTHYPLRDRIGPEILSLL